MDLKGTRSGLLVRARKLDRRQRIKPEITITFDNPLALVEVLTTEQSGWCKG